MRSCRSSIESKTSGSAPVLEELRGRGGGLDDRAGRRQVPVQHGDARVRLERLGARTDDLPVPDLGLTEVAHQGTAGDGDRPGVEEVLDLAEHGQQTAGPVEVLHQEGPGRLQVHEQRDVGPGRVEVVQAQLDAEPARDRQQVHDGVRRAADRGQRDDRVEERAAAEHPTGSSVGGDHLDGQASRLVGGLQQAAVRRRDAGRPRDRGTQRLGDHRHGRGGAHRVAVPAAADHRRLRLQEVVLGERAGTDLLAEPPDVGATAQRRAPEGAVQHRAPGYDERRDVDGRRCHQQGGDRLVAPAEEHHRVDRVGAQHLLGRHRRHVAPQHRGGADQRLAQGHDGQVERDPARLVDPLLHAAGDLVQVRVARRQVGGGVRDRDVRSAVEGVRRQSPPHPGPVQVGVAIGPGVPLAAAR